MSRNYTLFAPPDTFEKVVRRLAARSQNDGSNKLGTQSARTLLLVELGFRLFEILRIEDEYVTRPWVILSGMPLYEPRLANLSPQQRRAIANARQLIPYSARFAWQNALRDYNTIATIYRNYNLAQPEWKKQTIVDAKKTEGDSTCDPSRQTYYDEWLYAQLPFRTRKSPTFARAGTTYQFDARVQMSTKDRVKVLVTITFRTNQIDNVPKPPSVWLSTRAEPIPFQVQWADLEAEAQWVTEREHVLHERWGCKANDWVRRFKPLDLRIILPDGSVNPTKSADLTVTRLMHLAGMVASGKSTLAMLLAVFVARHRTQQRITIVVGDVQMAIQWTNQLNTWLCNDPETDTPVAVPLFGRSTRGDHIRAFYQSVEYRQFSERQQPHWGERWLSPLCPLQACLPDTTVTEALNGQLIIPGQEPCNGLIPNGAAEEEGADEEAPNELPKWCACPFIGICPQYQALRDMPTAPIWITTPGGFNARVPVQYDNRPISLGEIIYEQSDMVIVDEADAVLNWFDNQFAETLYLTGNNDSLLDKVALPSTGYAIRNRVMPPATARWIGGQQSAQQSVSAMLTLLDPFQGRDCLRRWVANHYFTPLHLFDRLATRLAGLEEVASPDLTEDEHKSRTEMIQPIRNLFERLLDDDDRLETAQPSSESGRPVYELSRIMQVINGLRESATSPVVHQQCANWIRQHFPGIEALLDSLRQQWEERQQQVATAKGRRKRVRQQEAPVDTIETLSYRLQFALTVLLLDQHNRTVLYEWENRPPTIQDDSPAYRQNTVLRSLLPLPPTGRQFGTYYARGDADSELRRESESKIVTLFAYTNIGRAYLLNFHNLLTDYTGRRGPNVLAMSGTSYLPGSTTFHVGTPQALLLPSAKAKKAIEKSSFHFCWQESSTGEPIRVSGNLQRVGVSLFTELANALAGHNGSGLVQQVLNELERLSIEYPCDWGDRQRILVFVNSYEQAYWAAQALQEAIPIQKNAIKFLIKDKSDYERSPHAIRRTDIEQFAQTNGQLLVAPMSAIGRGFNILNQHDKAAFGAVFFLTRPYPHPHDAQGIARELNCRALEWASDPNFEAWTSGDGLGGKAEKVRKLASLYWRLAESRTYYRTLRDIPDLKAKPRLDLAVTTIGYLIQAVGRLIRGNVPFKAYFIDAAWAPEWAKLNQPESSRTSLLAAIIETLTNYAAEDPIYQELYGPLADRFDWIENFERTTD